MKPHELAGRRIEELRNLARLTGEEFGNAMGALGFPMSRQTVWKIEKGSRPLSLDELFAAAYVLGVSPLALLDPGTDGTFEIGDGVALDTNKLGDWWIHSDHPRDDVSPEDVDRTLPSPLRSHYEDISFLFADRKRLSDISRLLTEGIGLLPEDDKESIATSVRQLLHNDKDQTDA